MKKFFLFFVIFVFFSVLAAEEVQVSAADQNTPVAAQEKETVEPANDEAAPTEENQESEAQKESVTTDATSETVQESAVQDQKPAEPEQKEVQSETRTQPEAAPAENVKEEPVQTTKTKELEVKKYDEPSKMFYNPSAGIGIGASIFSFRINNDFDFLLKHVAGGTDVYLGLEIDFRYSPYIDNHSIYEIPIQLNFLFDFPVNHRNIKRLSLWFSGGTELAFGYLSYYDYGDEYDDDGKDRDSRFKVMAAWGFGVNMLFKNDITLKLGFDSFYGKYPDLICSAGYRF